MSDTEKYAVIGHPIAHSKSPVIHKVFAEQTGENISYEAIDAAPEDLHTSVTRFIALGGRGLNVTVPHKEAVIELMDSLTARAELAGAVNTVSKLEDGTLRGDNTDGIGLIIDLQKNLALDLENMRILVLGAGGAARGILASLAELRPDELVVANRTLQRARDIAEEFADIGRIKARSFEELSDAELANEELADTNFYDDADGEQADTEVSSSQQSGLLAFDLVINATSAGLEGAIAPFPDCIVGPQTVCYDLSYSMQDTPFVKWAREHGAKAVHQGWGMLIEQAAESFDIWRDVRPETAGVREKLP